MNKKVKVTDFIASFIAKYAKHVFVGQGGSVVHLLDSIDRKKNLKNIPSQNEQAASLAADAYARLSGKIGFCVGTSGPGIINLLQGIACSYYDSIPTISFSGAVTLEAMKDRKIIRQAGFQQMDVVTMVKPFTKYAVLLKDPKRIKFELEKALYLAVSGRPGPVVLDLPDDVQRAYISPKNLKSFYPKKIKENKINIKLFQNLISKSKRPLVIVGNGINLSKTKNQLISFLEKSKIPYAPTWATVDIFYDKKINVQNAGIFGVAASRHGNFAVQNADLLICFGTRLNTQLTGSNPKLFAPKAKKIIVDIDNSEFKKTNQIKIDLKMNVCLKVFFKKISKIKFNKSQKYINWINRIKLWKKTYSVLEENQVKKFKFINPYEFMDSLSKTTKKNDIIIPDASANLIWAYQGYNFTKKQTMFTSLNNSPMGYSVSASIGAHLARKNSNVIAIIGDGSMQMNIQELQTIKNFNIPVKVFIMNNSGYGLIKQTQETWLKGNHVGVDAKSGLGLPDFLKVAKSYGLRTNKIQNSNNLQSKIKKVLSSKKTIICDVIIDSKFRVRPKIESGKPIDDMSPLLKRDELKKNQL